MTAPESDDWLLLLGPDQQEAADVPPAQDQIVGAWPVLGDGSAGRFVPNPLFRPRSAGVATDPFDAASRLWAQGELGIAQLFAVLEDLVFNIAVDESGWPVLSALPDGGFCVTVATAPAQCAHSTLPHWDQATLEDLVPILPAGTRIAVNPDSATSVLLDLAPASSQ